MKATAREIRAKRITNRAEAQTWDLIAALEELADLEEKQLPEAKGRAAARAYDSYRELGNIIDEAIGTNGSQEGPR